MSPQLVIQGPSATLTLCRPEVANKLTPDDLMQLRALIDQVNAATEVRVLKIEGQGRHFCSGFDISEILHSQVKGQSFGEMVDALEACQAITIACIQGGVFGGGVDLALACDFRVGSSQAQMQIPPAKLGLHFYPTGMRRLCTRLGVDASKRLLLRAQKLHGPAMLAIGLLTDMCAPQELAASVAELEQELLQMAPLALKGMKRNLNAIANHHWDLQQMEADVQASVDSADLREGMQAWLEKRRPMFTGN